jgi:two-component system NtrC family sensor kinase
MHRRTMRYGLSDAIFPFIDTESHIRKSVFRQPSSRGRPQESTLPHPLLSSIIPKAKAQARFFTDVTGMQTHSQAAINRLPAETLRKLLDAANSPAQACQAVAEEILGFTSATCVLLQRPGTEGCKLFVSPRDLISSFDPAHYGNFSAFVPDIGEPTHLQTGSAPAGAAQLLDAARCSDCLMLPVMAGSTRMATLAVFGIAPDRFAAFLDETRKLLQLLGGILAAAEYSSAPHSPEERHLYMAMLAVQNTVESIYWLDQDGNILYVNPAAEKELGYTAAELQRMRVSDIDPNAPPSVWGKEGEFAKRRRAGQMRNFKTQHRHRDGHLIPVEINSAPFDFDGRSYSMAICNDVSERLKSEDALRASEEKFSTIFTLTPDPLALTRLKDGVLLEVSHSYAGFFGYQREELLGRSSLPGPDGVGVWPDAAQRQRWQEQLEREGSLLGYETSLRRKDGSLVTVLISGQIVDIANEHCIIVNLRDISMRKRMEELLRQEKTEQEMLNNKLQEAQSQLLQSEKLAAIGQLAAGVAHEINNPIGFVRSNLTTLGNYSAKLLGVINAYETADSTLRNHPELFSKIEQARLDADLAFMVGDLRSLLAESLEGADRVRHIVQDLRDFSRIDSGQWQQADLHAGLESTINVVWNEIKYKAELVRDYGTLPLIECIPSRLNQVFMNLLVNAAQAIVERGKITISTRSDGNEVEIAIADTGKGIQPDVLPKIFNPFFTTKPVGKGTGLGLSVSYGIVRDHGGRIDVESEPGKGTTFTIRLPATRSRPAGKRRETGVTE